MFLTENERNGNIFCSINLWVLYLEAFSFLLNLYTLAPQHFTSQREDFEGSREGVLVWLTEMDLQLTNVEHFSQSHTEDKMRQLQVRQRQRGCYTSMEILLISFLKTKQKHISYNNTSQTKWKAAGKKNFCCL